MADVIIGVRTERGFERICRGMLAVPQQGSSGASPGVAEGAAAAERFGAGDWNGGAGHSGDCGEAAAPRDRRGAPRGGRHRGSDSSPESI